MTKAQRYVYELIRDSLRRKAKTEKWEPGAKAMLKEAEKYDKKLNPRGSTAVEPETGQPVPEGGQDNLPEEPNAAAEGHAPPSER